MFTPQILVKINKNTAYQYDTVKNYNTRGHWLKLLNKNCLIILKLV